VYICTSKALIKYALKTQIALKQVQVNNENKEEEEEASLSGKTETEV
jgi:hypothetical protein